jgi:hypothetical protein
VILPVRAIWSIWLAVNNRFGKDERPRLEPRILLEDEEKSYHAKVHVTDHDIFDNILIRGDNLLALKALEQDFVGRVKCVFIDPPYNNRRLRQNDQRLSRPARRGLPNRLSAAELQGVGTGRGLFDPHQQDARSSTCGRHRRAKLQKHAVEW